MHDINIKVCSIKYYLCYYSSILKNSNDLIQKIYIIFDVPRSTFYGWLKNYNEGILTLPKSERIRKNHKLTDEICSFIKNTINDYKTITINEIATSIKLKFNKKISTKSIYKFLKINKITYKRIHIKNNPIKKKKLRIHRHKFIKKIKCIKRNKIISIDETAIYLNCNPSYGWAQRGEKCIIIKNTNLVPKRYTLLLAISNRSIIHTYMCMGSVKKEQYLDFIKNVVNKVGKSYGLLMDNASIHTSEIFKNYTKEQKLNVIYNIPYNPETNPIENVFGWLKNSVKRKKNSTEIDIKTSIINYLKKITSEQLNATFERAFNFEKYESEYLKSLIEFN